MLFGFIASGKKLAKVPPKEQNLKLLTELQKRKFIPNHKFINQINSVQSSWKAVVYEDYSGMTVAQLMYRAGGLKRFDFPQPRLVTALVLKLLTS